MNCPACDSTRTKAMKGQIRTCTKCGAIFGTCYLGESYEFVLPYLTDADPEMTRSKYFDFTTLGSNGLGRRHGWFDPDSKRITQVG